MFDLNLILGSYPWYKYIFIVRVYISNLLKKNITQVLYSHNKIMFFFLNLKTIYLL